MPPNDLSERVEAIRKMLDLFRAERMVYLAVTICSLVVLLACAIYLLYQKADIVAVLGLFGSSGAITYTTGRVLRMWSEALSILTPVAKGEQP